MYSKRENQYLRFSKLHPIGLSYTQYVTMLDNAGHIWGFGDTEYATLKDVAWTYTPICICNAIKFKEIINLYGCSFAIKDDDNTLWWWGGNDYYVAGIGSTNAAYTSISPVLTTVGYSFKQVIGVNYSAYGLDYNGNVWAWGANNSGQLGNLNMDNQSVPISMVGDHSFIQITATEEGFLGLKDNGSVWGCGYNSFGELGILNKTIQSSPVSMVGDHSFIKITNTNTSFLGLKADGSCWCCGYGLYGQLGFGINRNDYSSPVSVAGDHSFIDILGFEHQCFAKKANGEFWGWGLNTSGQLMVGNLASQSSPMLSVLGNYSFTQISGDANFNYLGLKDNGELWGWLGSSAYANSSDVGALSPVVLNFESNIPIRYRQHRSELDKLKQLSYISDNCWRIGGISINNKLYMSHSGNSSYVTGVATYAPHTGSWTQQTDWNWKEMANSYYFQLGIRDDDTCWIWGEMYGFADMSPTAIIGGHQFVKVRASSNSAYGLKSDGTVWSWGVNSYGQLGNLNTASQSSPVSMVGDHSFIDISSGSLSFLGLKADGSCWGCGYNTYIALSTASKSSPISMVGNHSFIKIAGSARSGKALKEDGSCWAWGGNGYGNIGDYTRTNRSSPVSVIGDHSFIKIAHNDEGVAFGLKANGELWGWGTNGHGEMGLGTISYGYSSPLSIPGNNRYVDMKSSQYLVVALDENGDLWRWGSTTYKVSTKIETGYWIDSRL